MAENLIWWHGENELKLQECSNREAGLTDEKLLHIIGAYDVPRFSYSVERKKYLPDDALGHREPKLYAGKNITVFMFSTELPRSRP